MESRWSRVRFPLMGLSALSLLVAMATGLLRLGWTWPLGGASLLWLHGPLMVGGFLGTLIGVERAVALQLRWPYGAPLLSGVGALGLLLGLPTMSAICWGSVGLLVVSGRIWQRQPSLAMGTMGLGAGCWVVGNGCWLLGYPPAQVVPWWMAFLVLTIAGERLELSRFLQVSRQSQGSFLLMLGLWMLGLLWGLADFTAGMRVLGGAMLALAAWLWRFDIARRTVRRRALTRYIALCLLSGYGWLALSGLLHLRFGGMMAGPYYDAMLHTLFLGCVMTMVFAHGPVIFPAITGRAVPYHPALYLPVCLLQSSLLLRVSSDIWGWTAGRLWGGLFNAVALLSFCVRMGLLVWRGTAAATVATEGSGQSYDVHHR